MLFLMESKPFALICVAARGISTATEAAGFIRYVVWFVTKGTRHPNYVALDDFSWRWGELGLSPLRDGICNSFFLVPARRLRLVPRVLFLFRGSFTYDEVEVWLQKSDSLGLGRRISSSLNASLSCNCEILFNTTNRNIPREGARVRIH